MSNLTVLAFDPGGTTGWAAYQAEKIVNDEGIAEYFNEVHLCGSLGPEKHHEDLELLIEHMRTDNFHLVTESFEFRQGKQRTNINLMSKEYIGIMELWAKKNDVKLWQQTAAMGKGFVTDPKLKIMNLWSTNKHSRDARRHLIFYMVNKMQRTDLIASWRDLA